MMPRNDEAERARATARVLRLEDMLRVCHHDLTTHHHLTAHDGDPALAWQLDTSATLALIDGVLREAEAR